MKEYNQPVVLEEDEDVSPRFIFALTAVVIVNVAAAINAAFAVALFTQGVTTTNYSTNTTRM